MERMEKPVPMAGAALSVQPQVNEAQKRLKTAREAVPRYNSIVLNSARVPDP